MTYEFKAQSGFQEYFGKSHQLVRGSVKEFVTGEITPFIEAWEEAGEFPRDIYKKASDIGILGTGYPDAYGGTPGDIFFQIAVWEELMRSGSGHYRAKRRLGCSKPADHGDPGWRLLHRQRRQGIYYQRLPGRSDHLCSPNRRRRRAWHQLTCHRIQNSGLFRIRKIEKDRVVVIGYGADLF